MNRSELGSGLIRSRAERPGLEGDRALVGRSGQIVEDGIPLPDKAIRSVTEICKGMFTDEESSLDARFQETAGQFKHSAMLLSCSIAATATANAQEPDIEIP